MTKKIFAGIDVGGRTKGFHVAILAGSEVKLYQFGSSEKKKIANLLDEEGVGVVAVDSPIDAARNGERSRECEREFGKKGICGIRYTPEKTEIKPGGYYEWIYEGMELYKRLSKCKAKVVECFPTASWTIWNGPKKDRTRAQWTTKGLRKFRLNIDNGGRRLNQDFRDAIAAAKTAECCAKGKGRYYSDILPIVVPKRVKWL